jgi:hypothetical protein
MNFRSTVLLAGCREYPRTRLVIGTGATKHPAAATVTATKQAIKKGYELLFRVPSKSARWAMRTMSVPPERSGMVDTLSIVDALEAQE